MHDQQADDAELKVLRRTVLKSTAAGVGLAVLGGQAAGQDDEGDGDDAADEDAEFAEVVVPNQVTDGTTVEIESVTLPEGGFISLVDPVEVHDELPADTMPNLDELIAAQVQGASEFLESGTHEEIVIEFDEALEGEKLYQVWVHRDTTGDETFAYVDSVGEEDDRYLAEFEPPEEEEDEGEDGEGEDGEGEDGEDGEGEDGGDGEGEGEDGEGEGEDGEGEGEDGEGEGEDGEGEDGEGEAEGEGEEEDEPDEEDEEAAGPGDPEDENGAEEEEEAHPDQQPPVVMGDVFLHRIPEDVETSEQEGE